jgi:hypothetical protein
MSNNPRFTITTPGAVPKRINKPSVGMNDEISVIYPDPGTWPPEIRTDLVPRRELCARLDGFPEVELVRTHRRNRVVAIAEPAMLEQWLRSRPGGWDGTIHPRFTFDT